MEKLGLQFILIQDESGMWNTVPIADATSEQIKTFKKSENGSVKDQKRRYGSASLKSGRKKGRGGNTNRHVDKKK